MACRVDKFSPSACLPVSTSKPVKLVYVCVCVWSLCGTEMCVCVCMSVTDRAIESTYRENLTTPLHPECLCPHGYTLPSSPSFFAPPAQHVLSQRCTPACLKLSHSPGALSSVGGNTLKVVSHDRVKCNTPVGCTVHIFKCTLVKEKKKIAVP